MEFAPCAFAKPSHGQVVALLSSAVREGSWRLEADRHKVFFFALKAFVVDVFKSSKVISVVFFVCVCHCSVTAQNVLRGGVEVVEVSPTKSQEWKDTPTPPCSLRGACGPAF